MIRIFKTVDGKIHQMDEVSEGCWLALTDPTATEIFEVAKRYNIEVDDLRAPLDEEERSRIEVEDDYTLIIVDTPILEERGEKDWYGTIPLSIIVTDEIIITVCLEDTSVFGQVHGWTSTKFLYLHEDQIHSSDSVQECKYVPALPAYHR